MKHILGALSALLLFATTASAQITIPNTLVAGATIRAAELNTNFSTLGDKALNRLSGGTIEGNITFTDNITIDGVDLSDFLQTTGEVRSQTAGLVTAPAYSRTGDTSTGVYFPGVSGEVAVSLAGVQRLLLNASGVTAYGVNIINATGKIPALTASYFTSVDASTLTGLNASALASGSVPDARLSANVPLLNAATNVYTGGATIGGTLGVTGATTVGAFTASGATALPSTFRVGTAATAGFVLTADALGNATWQAPGVSSGAVPSGLIAMFDAACPTTWTRVAAWDNKFVRGGATYVLAGGGADTHNHTVDPAAVTSGADGAHAHTVDPLAVTSSAAGAHGHTTDSQGAHAHDVRGNTAVAGAHNHTGTTDIAGAHTHTTSVFEGTGVVAAVGGADSAGAHAHTFTTSSVADHAHAVDIATNSGGAHAHTAAAVLDHSHSVDVAATTSSTSATHTHAVDVASTTSSSGANVPAYVQVVFCRKD